MKSVLILGLLITAAYAVPTNSVYPNSGPTDAKTDQQTDIGEISRNPIEQGTGSIKQQQEEEMPESEAKENKKFDVGPYDREGNFKPDYRKADETPGAM